jgi:hypothetical protein
LIALGLTIVTLRCALDSILPKHLCQDDLSLLLDIFFDQLLLRQNLCVVIGVFLFQHQRSLLLIFENLFYWPVKEHLRSLFFWRRKEILCFVRTEFPCAIVKSADYILSPNNLRKLQEIYSCKSIFIVNLANLSQQLGGISQNYWKLYYSIKTIIIPWSLVSVC